MFHPPVIAWLPLGWSPCWVCYLKKKKTLLVSSYSFIPALTFLSGFPSPENSVGRQSRTRAKEAHTAGAYPFFCSMKQLRVLLLPPWI